MELIRTLLFVFFVFSLSTVDCNSEGDALIDLRTRLTDPNNVLQSWNSTLVNPCTWFHVTCNNKNSVIRVDLGNAGLSGTLSPSLSNLTNLQYLEIYSNKISGIIPNQIGYLSKLISLGLDDNRFSGTIPSSFGNLRSLRFLKLQGNYLAGIIPTEVIQLVKWGNLQVMNVSSNMLAGTIRRSKTTTGFVTTIIVQDPKAPK